MRKSLLQCLMALLWMVALSWAPAAHAQGLESVLSPGPLSQSHVKWENDCKSCHVRFNPKGQDGLCMDCHKELAQDVRSKTGYHGRMKPQQCRSCHTEHRGANGRIFDLDERRFDHVMTDFALRGKHQKVECSKCHERGKKHRLTPQDCNSCHKKDDVHKGSLGPACKDCHSEVGWKERLFNHDKTRFSLTGRHAETKCADCHRNNQYKDTPRECIACHKKEDEGKGHKGQFGARCETCHTAERWDVQKFNHDTDTEYTLLGKHRATGCTACHTGPLYAIKLSQVCFDCHKKDDKHKESLGRDCAKCHTEQDWREPAKFDHDRTRFPLRNAHVGPKVRCESCHLDPSKMRNTPRDCYSCHKKDDKHDGLQGRQCEQCHNDKSWKVPGFDHSRTKFPLTGRHMITACKDCHASQRFKDAKSDCFSCHQKIEKHKGKFGTKCETCHNTRAWAIWNFDHDKRTKYKLEGGHRKAACERCHTRPAPSGANIAPVTTTCVSCHRADDRHDGAFGTRCESCHTSEAWKKTTNTRITGQAPSLEIEPGTTQSLGMTSYFNRIASSTLGQRWLQ